MESTESTNSTESTESTKSTKSTESNNQQIQKSLELLRKESDEEKFVGLSLLVHLLSPTNNSIKLIYDNLQLSFLRRCINSNNSHLILLSSHFISLFYNSSNEEIHNDGQCLLNLIWSIIPEISNQEIQLKLINDLPAIPQSLIDLIGNLSLQHDSPLLFHLIDKFDSLDSFNVEIPENLSLYFFNSNEKFKFRLLPSFINILSSYTTQDTNQDTTQDTTSINTSINTSITPSDNIALNLRLGCESILKSKHLLQNDRIQTIQLLSSLISIKSNLYKLKLDSTFLVLLCTVCTTEIALILDNLPEDYHTISEDILKDDENQSEDVRYTRLISQLLLPSIQLLDFILESTVTNEIEFHHLKFIRIQFGELALSFIQFLEQRVLLNWNHLENLLMLWMFDYLSEEEDFPVDSLKIFVNIVKGRRNDGECREAVEEFLNNLDQELLIDDLDLD